MRRKKNDRIMVFILLLACISVGYAAIANSLKISGTALVHKNTWNVYWDTPVVTTGSVSMTAPTRTNDNNEPANTKLTWNVTLDIPGDYYEFTVDAVNAGSIDAMITDITNTVSPTLPSYVTYSITYDNDIPIAINHLLPKAKTENNGLTPSRQKFKVRVEYSAKNATAATINGMEGDETYTFTFGVQYGQATSSAQVPTFLSAGDYFTLVPDEATATTSYEGLSCSISTADQTLWRVINVNNDGTVEAVSHYTSSSNVTIEGINGYKNYIAGLNEVASYYAKEGYTIATRMMGYDGQTEVIQDISVFDGSMTPSNSPELIPPSTSSTSTPTTGTGEEFSGGVLGDNLYLRDYLLVKAVYNNDLTATTKFSSSKSIYWLASRLYIYTATRNFSFKGRCMDGNNFNYSNIRYYYDSWKNDSSGFAVRPIITLSAGLLKANGTGTSVDPYTFR